MAKSYSTRSLLSWPRTGVPLFSVLLYDFFFPLFRPHVMISFYKVGNLLLKEQIHSDEFSSKSS